VVVVAEPGLAISGLMTPQQIWLLAVFTEGVLALLGGLSVWIGTWARSHDAQDIGQDAEAIQWVTAFGVFLLTIYSVGWFITRT